MQLLSEELIKCGDLVQGAYDGLISKNIHSDSFGEAVLSAEDFIGSKGLQCFGEDAQRYTVGAVRMRSTCRTSGPASSLDPIALCRGCAGADALSASSQPHHGLELRH
jgi:hypothetical protein